MNPNLQYAQAIHGRVTGRGIGIIDTLHLVEVARAVEVLVPSKALSSEDTREIRKWFAAYLTWMTTSPNGMEERDAKNNHGTCWLLQVAEFTHLTRNEELQAYCRNRFKTLVIPTQMAEDGSFPLEVRRTKPYGYSLFNLEAMAGICQALSTPDDNLWEFELPDGRGMARAMAFMTPYIRDKRKWPYPPDVMYDDQWPVRQTSLLFAGVSLKRPDYIALWQSLKPYAEVEEVVRNFFLRQPELWLSSKQ